MFSSLLKNKKGKRVFLDYASTTPIDERVRRAMNNVEKFFANPSAIYKEASRAREVLDDSREKVASVLGCKADEIIFTASGTESCNLAIRGLISDFKNSHIVTTAIEHPAILNSCKFLERMGVGVDYVPVALNGVVSAESVLRAVKPETKLVSVMYVNNETGAIQTVREIGDEIKKSNQKRENRIYFHTDASQAPCFLSVAPQYLNVDLITLDGSKIYGPKGVGVLFKKRGIDLDPIIFGGGQEFGLRSGTENIVGICGFAEALKIAVESRETEADRIGGLKKKLYEMIVAEFPFVSLNGEINKTSPHILSVCFPETDSEFLVLKLDALGMACSASSACRARGRGVPSHVLNAMGKKECSNSSLRFSLGRSTDENDIIQACEVLKKVVIG